MIDFALENIPDILDWHWESLRSRIIHELKEAHQRGYDRGYDSGYQRGFRDAEYEKKSR